MLPRHADPRTEPPGPRQDQSVLDSGAVAGPVVLDGGRSTALGEQGADLTIDPSKDYQPRTQK